MGISNNFNKSFLTDFRVRPPTMRTLLSKDTPYQTICQEIDSKILLNCLLLKRGHFFIAEDVAFLEGRFPFAPTPPSPPTKKMPTFKNRNKIICTQLTVPCKGQSVCDPTTKFV